VCRSVRLSVCRSVCRRVFYLGVQMFCSETLSSSAFSTYFARIHVLLYCTYSFTVVYVYVYRRGRCLLLVSSSRRKHPTQLFVDRGASLPVPLQSNRSSHSKKLTNTNELGVRLSKNQRTHANRTKCSLISACSLTFGEQTLPHVRISAFTSLSSR